LEQGASRAPCSVGKRKKRGDKVYPRKQKIVNKRGGKAVLFSGGEGKRPPKGGEKREKKIRKGRSN